MSAMLAHPELLSPVKKLAQNLRFEHIAPGLFPCLMQDVM
jgi:hypothetical protein